MNYNNCEFLASYGLSRQLPDSDRPEIVFSGRSNVGKSSLINKLCNRRKLEYLHYHRIPFVAALTKGDKLKKSEMAARQAEFEQICAPYGCRKVILTSAENGQGMEELRALLETAAATE